MSGQFIVFTKEVYLFSFCVLINPQTFHFTSSLSTLSINVIGVNTWRLSGEFPTGMLIFSFRRLLFCEMTGSLHTRRLSMSTFWAFLSYFSPTVWTLRRWHCQVVLHFVDWSFLAEVAVFSFSVAIFILSSDLAFLR